MMSMELQETKHQIKLAQWRGIVYECRNSGIAVKTWCKNNQINVSTYYRWQKLVWESGSQHTALSQASPAETTFAEYRPQMNYSNSSAAIILQLGEIRLEIQNGASPETIEAVIHIITSYVK
ncbi:hypothetical protein LJB89_01515 [Tyzzerella sp. OttesenSCG-928-J15]|nr:hypothetical protein [Tyzzerella sp. OttesenSCG-928-J15]